jgi:hypothetical protein
MGVDLGKAVNIFYGFTGSGIDIFFFPKPRKKRRLFYNHGTFAGCERYTLTVDCQWK